MKDKFMKNGVFSLEYDKETLRDIVLELQEENKKQKEVIDKAIKYIKKYDDDCYTDETCKYKVAELNITELLDILKGDKND